MQGYIFPNVEGKKYRMLLFATLLLLIVMVQADVPTRVSANAIAQIQHLIENPAPDTKPKLAKLIPLPTRKKPMLDRNQRTELSRLLFNLESEDLDLIGPAYHALQKHPYNIPEYVFHL
ncbi:hypothetical protein DdX_09995 [Ditylenchus destructor]|uniref:Uncharacterized protein n=1 Tax=Ditylenchus destructor TaxID=166010 RepID=A0AAD4N0K6_9BILA|nr:hypothetical protein DdX_09995 [Ditylenchus destructor]